MQRIDVHSHLLPGIDDGCPTIEESLACAQMLVDAGYSHAFCTPHIWPNDLRQNRQTLPHWTADLQSALATAGIPLTVMPGGELNLHPTVMETPLDRLVSPGLMDRYILVDMWAQVLPEWFDPTIKWLQERGLTVILAHPERMRAVQEKPELADKFEEMGILLQGNLQCFADRPDSYTRQTAELYLDQDRYFLLGSDTHNTEGLKHRLMGLKNAIKFAGNEKIDQLTKINPRKLLPTSLLENP